MSDNTKAGQEGTHMYSASAASTSVSPSASGGFRLNEITAGGGATIVGSAAAAVAAPVDTAGSGTSSIDGRSSISEATNVPQPISSDRAAINRLEAMVLEIAKEQVQLGQLLRELVSNMHQQKQEEQNKQ